MIRTRTLVLVLVVTVVGLTTGAGVGSADTQANEPYNLEAIATITGGDVGQHTSIAFNENTGKPYISYYDATNQDLRLIYPHDTAGNCGPNNKWYCEALDTVGDVGQYSSIDYFVDSVTGDVKIGIAYYDATNDQLKAAIWSRFGFTYRWDVYTVGIDPLIGNAYQTGRYASLKIDSNGTVHIAYVEHYRGLVPGFEDYGAKHAYSVSSGGDCGDGVAAGKWQCDSIFSNDVVLPSSTSLDLTSMDAPVVAFIDDSDELTLCGKVSGTWSCVAIDGDAGPAASLAIDQSGLPHIGYYDSSNGNLKYATYVGTGGNCGDADEYQCDIIDSIGDSQSLVGLSVDVDLDGLPVIAYQDSSELQAPSKLRVARPASAHGLFAGNCGPMGGLFHLWQCTTIDPGDGDHDEADYSAVGVDPDGAAHIAYYEQDGYNNEGRLKLAHQEFADPIFSDDFETGGVSGWTSSVGGP